MQAIARWLIKQGVQPDDHIAVLGDNSPEWEASYLGIQKAGGIGIPIDRMLPATGIRFLLSESKAKFLFTSTNYLKALSEVSEVETLNKTINFDDDGFADHVSSDPASSTAVPGLD